MIISTRIKSRVSFYGIVCALGFGYWGVFVCQTS